MRRIGAWMMALLLCVVGTGCGRQLGSPISYEDFTGTYPVEGYVPSQEDLGRAPYSYAGAGPHFSVVLNVRQASEAERSVLIQGKWASAETMAQSGADFPERSEEYNALALKATEEAMALEVRQAFKRRAARERRAELRRDLNPAAQLQPKERSLRYENLRSARAEEGILRLLIRDESLFPEEPPLREEQFSSPLLGRAFTTLWQAKAAGRVPSLAAQAEFFSQEEMNHLTGVCQQPESLRNGQQALADYIRIVQTEAEKRLGGGTADPLLAATEKYKDKKGTGGKQHGK